MGWFARPPKFCNTTVPPGDFVAVFRPSSTWQPVVDVTYKTVWKALGGPLYNAFPGLVWTSIVLHGVSVVAFCVLACTFLDEYRSGLIATLFFAFHPLHADLVWLPHCGILRITNFVFKQSALCCRVVQVVSGLRYNILLCGLFYALSVRNYVLAVRKHVAVSGRRLIIALVSALAAAACHSVGLTVFPVLIGYDVFVARYGALFPKRAREDADTTVGKLTGKPVVGTKPIPQPPAQQQQPKPQLQPPTPPTGDKPQPAFDDKKCVVIVCGVVVLGR